MMSKEAKCRRLKEEMEMYRNVGVNANADISFCYKYLCINLFSFQLIDACGHFNSIIISKADIRVLLNK